MIHQGTDSYHFRTGAIQCATSSDYKIFNDVRKSVIGISDHEESHEDISI